MLISVRLLNRFEKTLTYEVPEDLIAKIEEGTLIEVPLQNRTEHALVLACNVAKPSGFAIKKIAGIVARPADVHYHSWLCSLTTFYDTTLLDLYARLFSSIAQHETTPKEEVSWGANYASQNAVTLTDEQQAIVDSLRPIVVDSPSFKPSLLHGVTGSGKTEVYKQLLVAAISAGKTAFFLCPEVSLARQFVSLFTEQLSSCCIHAFDSASTKNEKRLLWQHLLEKRSCIVVGVHMPVLLPVANLGLIIVDEEHEPGFQEKKQPHMNSKHLALWRAQSYGIPILLGSATPSVATLYRAKQGGWQQFFLTKRFAGNFPTIKHVVLRDHSKRKHFWFSPELLASINQTISRGEQVILYVNRRGYSVCMQCKQCAHVYECPACSVSLTVHKKGTVQELRCHYCDHFQIAPATCASCSASTEKATLKGIGTQQVVQLLEKIIPHAVIARADADVSRKKKEWQQVLSDFSAQKIHILVGTQIITKGYHFPQVTLVGIIWGDSNLHFPEYNAHEVALQQLIQVAGRAGRFHEKSTVIVQSFSEHPIFSFVSEERYPEFAAQEIEMRTLTQYPPAGRIVMIEIRNKDVLVLEKDARTMHMHLAQAQKELSGLRVLGPARPMVHKINNVEVRTIMLKAHSFAPLFKLLSLLKKKRYNSSWYYLPL